MSKLSLWLLLISHSALSQNGPILHVSFDKNGTDHSSNGRHGSLHGCTISSEAKVGGGSVLLDGQDDYISFPADVYFTDSYSISLWAKPLNAEQWTRFMDFNQDEPQTGNAITWLIGRKDSGNNMWFDQWVMHDGKAVESILDFNKTEPADAYLDYDVSIGEWHHFVITYQPDTLITEPFPKNINGEEVPIQGLVRLYVDGSLKSTSKLCLKPQSVPTTANWLGRSRYAADPYYHGFLDDFRIYDRKISHQEVVSLYELGK